MHGHGYGSGLNQFPVNYFASIDFLEVGWSCSHSSPSENTFILPFTRLHSKTFSLHAAVSSLAPLVRSAYSSKLWNEASIRQADSRYLC